MRKKGFEGRRLGPKQMTTDTAVRVTRTVVEGKGDDDGLIRTAVSREKAYSRVLSVPLGDIVYLDCPELQFNEKESTQMPFRYVKGDDGKPVMPEVSKSRRHL